MMIDAVAGGESTGATEEGESRYRQRGEHRLYRMKDARITVGSDHRYCQRG